jgi:hypothetical protein
MYDGGISSRALAPLDGHGGWARRFAEKIAERTVNGRGEYLTRSGGRKTYGGCAEITKARYVRVAASIIATIDGNINSCILKKNTRGQSRPPSIARETTCHVERV